MSPQENLQPCEKCQGPFPADLPVCPFCGKTRAGAEKLVAAQVVAGAEGQRIEAMASVLEQGCPGCQGPGRPLPIFVETWEDAGITLTGKSKYTVRSADVLGYCSTCSSGLATRRWLAAALMAAPIWVLAFMSGASGSSGMGLIAALYGLYLVKHLSYSWADYLVYGIELQTNLQSRISRFSPVEASVHFPVGCLHTILRLVFICASSLAMMIAGDILFSGRPAAHPAVDQEEGGRVEPGASSPFDTARGLINRQDSKALADLIRTRPELRTAQDSHGVSLMHYAVDADNGSLITDLGRAGCKSDLVDTLEGFTPLHWAARNGKAASLDALLKLGTRINPRSKVGHTPLHLAVLQRQLPICELLLKNQAEVNPRTETGRTPLYFALSKNFPEIADLLRKAGGTE